MLLCASETTAKGEGGKMTWLKNLQTALEPYPWAYTLLVVLVLAGITLLVNFITKFILYRGLRNS